MIIYLENKNKRDKENNNKAELQGEREKVWEKQT